ncbi:hypothetical protein AWC38_SpisGene22367 [Stylophora pistillata]|uniref:Uncharacterized protein n=1 Tax=Stylophora pistillata TaxID=50429 RepID=A0A2B4R7C1_STYPI|nr:hypothetical protein AWC38_SpisGene22367 [Stylophora pistillata]
MMTFLRARLENVFSDGGRFLDDFETVQIGHRRRGGFVIQRHNELRDLEADLLRIVSSDVEVEPILQQITGETLNRGANIAPDARLDIQARGFWERQRSAFFDIRVCHPNAESYRKKTPKQVYRQHESEKKRQYANRVMEIE